MIDDTDLGRPIADAFQEAFRTLDGQVERRALNPGADAATLLDPLGSWPPAEALVFFGGFVDSGAPELRRAMVSEGYRDVPFLGWDGVFAGTPRGESFVDVTGDAAVGS